MITATVELNPFSDALPLLTSVVNRGLNFVSKKITALSAIFICFGDVVFFFAFVLVGMYLIWLLEMRSFRMRNVGHLIFLFFFSVK